MKFIDECKIEVYAGKGGNGIVSFRKEAYVSYGGPNGGDGGNGGSIYFVGNPGINTLINFQLKKIIRGYNGENGRKKNQHGASGKNTYLKVPMGTLVYNGQKLIHDITKEQSYLIAKGGVGGRGNTKFKSSKNQAPRLFENGTKGETFEARLELKILADVGLIGKPSAGKSTLLSKISNAKPKIANYDFTTIVPQLGLVSIYPNSFVVADLPGLIKGAAQGRGLGHTFLKHIERCRVIAHIIDFGDPEKDPIEDFKIIKQELDSYSQGFKNKMQIIIANKKDLTTFDFHVEKFRTQFPQLEIIEISALKEEGINALKFKLYQIYQKSKLIKDKKSSSEITIELEEDVVVKKNVAGKFEVSGKVVEKIFEKIPLTTNDNFIRFTKLIRNIGVWKQLVKQGVKNGDSVKILDYEFIWKDDVSH